MTKQEKTNLRKGLAVLIISFLFFIPAIVLNFVYNMPALDNSSPTAAMMNHAHGIPFIDEPATEVELELNFDLEDEPAIEHIIVPRTFIVEKAPIKKEERPKEWVCKEPRNLVQGSGQVRECKFK